MPSLVPPGRAGRLWLLARLASARRSAELLDQKRRLIRNELERLEARHRGAAEEFDHAYRMAATWGRRAMLLGGAADVAHAATPLIGQASVEVPWESTMGVMFPGEPRCWTPSMPPLDAAASNAAVAPAASAYRDALESGVRTAAAESALRLVRSELAETERRLRAIEHHRIPTLERNLHDLDIRLDEIEREERVITRWATQRRDTRRALDADLQHRMHGGGH